MTVYTSNYARHNGNPKAIAISCTVKDWIDVPLHIKELAPTWQMVQAHRDGNLSNDEYKIQYLELLEKRNIDPKIFEQMEDGTMLLCYESPGDFCHRRILAEWVESKTGFVIPEWKNEKEVQESKQQELVDSVLEF